MAKQFYCETQISKTNNLKYPKGHHGGTIGELKFASCNETQTLKATRIKVC